MSKNDKKNTKHSINARKKTHLQLNPTEIIGIHFMATQNYKKVVPATEKHWTFNKYKLVLLYHFQSTICVMLNFRPS